jgi:signal transduction histidine kinase
LDEQELESWQKLIRVLTHEIMNSTGPITSCIDTILEFLIDEDSGEIKKTENITQSTVQDILQGISIIKERSLGLSEFVQNFRSLTILPKIFPTKFLVEDLFNHIPFLFAEEIHSKGIEMNINVLPKKLELTADSKLIEQVIINLIHNSIDAVANKEKKQICLKSFINSNNRIVCQVIDNGKGIPEDLIDTIFVPFFTTKAKGSGIGLTLSREIMKLHGGSIKAFSEPGKETIFTLEF